MNRGARFLQSALDHPCMVKLGERKPGVELNRWGRDVLRFKPLIGDSYTLRGDSRTLVYRGEKQNHRFTILDGKRFEYDIILKNEPDSNTLCLEIAGWEAFDFFRQPDTSGPEILRGSYAVYKKEFVISGLKYHVGTGKICHIHRPLIWDSRGRKVWGDIQIHKGILSITIPEHWLGEAAYPVTVDPVFGSATVGAYNQWRYLSTESYQYYLRDQAEGENPDLNEWGGFEKVLFSDRSHFNKVTASVPMQGAYEAYIYSDESIQNPKPGGGYYYNILGFPIAYNNVSGKPKYPLMNISAGGDCRVDSVYPKSFRKGTFNIADRINPGTEFWFGFSCGDGYFSGRFDYGGVYWPLYWGFIASSTYSDYEEFNEMLVSYEMDELKSYHWDTRFIPGNSEYNAYPGARFDFKVSMYLQVSSENYIRTLTQGIKLTDNQKLTGTYKRTATQTVKGTAETKHTGIFNRILAIRGDVSDNLFKALTWPRRVVDTIRAEGRTESFRELIRKIALQVKITDLDLNNMELRRDVVFQAAVLSALSREQGLVRSVLNTFRVSDAIEYPVIWFRQVTEQEKPVDVVNHVSAYLRGLFIMAGSLAETKHTGEYYRKQTDTAHIEAVSLRHLFIFIMLFTTGLVRDFIIRRFLKSNEDIVLKSCVCREITIESSIH